MTRHPQDRAARRRSKEAKALEHLVPKRINAKKRQIQVHLLEEETADAIKNYGDYL